MALADQSPYRAVADPELKPVIRFGAFEADRHTGELRKAGLRVRLANQPFRVLIALLDRPGEMVTRAELQQVLWKDDTAGNFEQGLNRAINKVRSALCDSATTPRFIETLPGHGYRFVGTVEQEAPAESGEPVAPHRHPASWAAYGAAALLIVALAAYAFWNWLPPPIPELRWRKLTTDNFGKVAPALSDGSRVYFLANYGGESFLAQIPAKGGQPVRLPVTLPGPVSILQDLSPDGQEILLTAGTRTERTRLLPLWTLQIADGTARRVGAASATSAAFSPASGAIAYTTESEIWLTDRAGAPRRLAELKDSVLSAVTWDPTGRRIRFARQNPLSSQSSAWEIGLDGTGLRPVAPKWRTASTVPVGWLNGASLELFAADGGFWMWRAGWSPFRPAAETPTRLTQDEPEFSERVRLRGASEWMAIGVDRLGELQRYDVAKKEWKPLLDGISAEAPDFSRDGRRVVYVAYPQRTLWVRDADGKRPIQLTSPPMIAGYPRWSPDGMRIVFNAQEAPDLPMRIYLVDADGGAIRAAAPSDSGSQGDPTWSPDGNRLVYGLSIRSSRESAYIRIVDLHTGKVEKLPGSDGLFSPRWSPRGDMVAALERDGRHRLMVYRFDRNQWTALSDSRADWPSWSPDGKTILFRGTDALRRIDVETKRDEMLVALKGEEIGGFTHASTLTSAGEPIRTLNRDGQQVYELYLQGR